MRKNSASYNISFEGAIYNVEEQEVLIEQIALAFSNDTYSTHFAMVDCSRIHVANVPKRNACVGFCIDSGALKLDLGMNQLNYILQVMGMKGIPRTNSGNSFWFFEVTFLSQALTEIALDTLPNIRTIHILMDIVTVDIHTLFGIDILDGENLYSDNVTNRLVHRKILSGPEEPLMYEDSWNVQLIRYSTHLYARMNLPRCTFLYFSTTQ